MRLLTFGQLVTVSKDYCIDTSEVNFDGLSTTEDFIKREINSTVKYIFSLLREYKLEPPPYTFSTVADIASYDLPISSIGVDTVTLTAGGINYNPKPVYSQAEYDALTLYSDVSSIPQRYFIERDTISFFPRPQGVYTATVNYNYQPKQMTVDDISSGTATTVTTAGVTTVTLTEAIVTSAWVGRFFAITDGTDATSYFYKIATTTSTSAFTLDRVPLEADAAGLSYVVGESVDMPVELFEWIPWRVASVYYATRRKEFEQAQGFSNMFYTGDLNNAKRGGGVTGGILLTLKQLQELGRTNSNLVETKGGYSRSFYDTIWATVTS